MSVVLSVAPPDGWQAWPASRIKHWFTNEPRAMRSVGSSNEVDSLKVTILFRLENGAKGKRFPILDELHLGSGVLPSAAIRRFLAETARLAIQLRQAPVHDVLSLRNYFDRLDLTLPPDRLAAQKRKEWKRVLSGATRLDPLPADELDFQTRQFLSAYPNRRRLAHAWDLFGHIVRAYGYIGQRALTKSHGVVLS